jgi:S-adenosylmethionine/arginine decarboxylase-like enzyme
MKCAKNQCGKSVDDDYFLLPSSEANRRYKHIGEDYKRHNAWGLETQIDLYDCNLKTMQDADKVKRHILHVVKLIGAEAYGDCQIINFGSTPEVAGFSSVQLIDTSLVSGHYADKTRDVFLNVFSCKYYDPRKVVDYSKRFFEAKAMDYRCMLRRSRRP